MMHNDYLDIIFEITEETKRLAEEAGFEYSVTGGSVQSCSSYFSLSKEVYDEKYDEWLMQELKVRISDHPHVRRISIVDFHVGLFSDHGSINIYPERVYVDYDDDGSSRYTYEDEKGPDSELLGFEVDEDDIKEIAKAILKAAMEKEPE